MKILALDTSTKFLSIALMEDDKCVLEYHEPAGIRHSEILVPTIQKMLKKLKWKIRDISLVCVGLGPGSFTGLRIAIATVKALAAALDVKVKGVPTMDAMALGAGDAKVLIAPLLDAHKGKVYSAIYKKDTLGIKRESDYLLLTIEELLGGLKDPVLFFGDSIAKYKDQLDKCPQAQYDETIDWYPRAKLLGRLGFERLGEGADDPEVIDPLYLHSKECNITR